jgi:hypothetical protein
MAAPKRTGRLHRRFFCDPQEDRSCTRNYITAFQSHFMCKESKWGLANSSRIQQIKRSDDTLADVDTTQRRHHRRYGSFLDLYSDRPARWILRNPYAPL